MNNYICIYKYTYNSSQIDLQIHAYSVTMEKCFFWFDLFLFLFLWGWWGINKLILKLTCKSKESRIAKRTKLENPHYQTSRNNIKIPNQCGIGKEQTQTSILQSPEIEQNKYGQLIFGKGRKRIQFKKDVFFNKWYSNNLTSSTGKKKKKKNLDPNAKFNSI